MPRVPGGTLRHDIVWSIENGNELAVTSLHSLYSVAWGDGPDWDAVQAQADGARDVVDAALTSSWSDLSSAISNSAHIVRVDTYALDPATGKAGAKATTGYGPTDLKGASAANMLPPSVAVTLGLWAFPVGGWQPDPRRWKGRLFLPGMVQSVLDGSTGLVSDTFQTSLATSWGSFFSRITGGVVGLGHIDAVILSRRDTASRKIVAVTVSKVPSVQRRRVNALAHTHGAGVSVS